MFKNIYVNAKKKQPNYTATLILGLIIGIVWTANWYMYQDLRADYERSITIYNQVMSRRDEVQDIKTDVTHEGALPQASLNMIEEESTTPLSVEEWDGTIEVSAYNAEIGQTDSSPTITANGDTVYEGGIASNCYDFGTQIEIEGLGVFTVNDRMNSRYECGNADIFLWSHDEAINFGRKELRYRIVG